MVGCSVKDGFQGRFPQIIHKVGANPTRPRVRSSVSSVVVHGILSSLCVARWDMQLTIAIHYR